MDGTDGTSIDGGRGVHGLSAVQAGGHPVGVRFHGRGGQGVVTAAELLSVAAFIEGHHAQAFPSFGSERAGAPVVAFCRISDRPIRTRAPIVAPDVVIVQDLTLVHQLDLCSGLPDDGYLLVNSGRAPTGERPLGHVPALADVAARLRPDRVAAVGATDLAQQHIGRPVPNAVLLGALAALTGIVGIDAVAAAIAERFEGAVAGGNQAAARAAYDAVAPAAPATAARPGPTAPASRPGPTSAASTTRGR